MARKKPRPKGKESRGVRGPRGPAGPPGPDGPVVTELGGILARVAQEMEDVQRTLRVQFTRIAQLQAEIDEVRLNLLKAN